MLVNLGHAIGFDRLLNAHPHTVLIGVEEQELFQSDSLIERQRALQIPMDSLSIALPSRPVPQMCASSQKMPNAMQHRLPAGTRGRIV